MAKKAFRRGEGFHSKPNTKKKKKKTWLTGLTWHYGEVLLSAKIMSSTGI